MDQEKAPTKRQEPTEQCKSCPYADWIDMYGTVIWGCDMGSCRLEREEEALW